MCDSNLSCLVCKKAASVDVTIFRCSRCHERLYCGKPCQNADWKTHKRICGRPPAPPGAKWYDKYRLCRDGASHEGDLELITWPCPAEGTGWGHIAYEESDALRAKFEGEFGGDEERLLKYWRGAFRWTCCGTHANMDWGCDHHGSGERPCSCDFCHMGKPLPASMYNEKTASRHGLTLLRGPDPRSFNRLIAINTAVNRTMMKMPMYDGCNP